ncbi:MAG: GGDEF domain-containing phosphodiesterase [Pseudomonadales bacterium]|jgi:diguanylate cyclase (GGDEF)-like protein|nr:GGDEF domain-containing phosphodiesterase [Pseudomonadales bacterium]MDP4639407.1 GGDEF domain-containing phosphodiesterase [Pseudomonadales bacterium]MDP4876113.1 GGDEF domain-containing phosphodiesterase [Pseudomonadales bacterium]MDP4911956.1 GGDEF domain-containing phosphodiesterase [Pseudomonadales bacterium]MDP5058257.1 GGDEF domain-containing phosphodiesterase [Pseudomonadales bacterium]
MMDMDVQRIDTGKAVEKYPNVISLSAYRLLRVKDESLLAEALRNTSRAAVLTIRINGYQMLLQTFAGCSGEQIAHQVEKQLLTSLRETDFAVHVSPDEFVVLITDISETTDIEDVATRIIRACSYLESHEAQPIPVSIDIGISHFPADARSAGDLLRFAHIALHTLDTGRHGSYQVFSQALRTRHCQGMTMTGELIQAMQDNRIELMYQPIYNMRTDYVVGVEALVRLRTTTGELLAADEFIDVAERSGLIVPLGEWIIRQACSQLAEWQAAGAASLRMSINVSPLQLQDPGFCRVLEKAVASADISFADIEIEIIERQQVDGSIDAVLGRLRQLGVKVAVDDFGTGYSSLANLARYPLDAVKIDQSFIRAMLDNVVARSIVAAIFAIATELNLKVIAEGVETVAQENHLRQLGCLLAQGFVYARPLSATVLSHLFSQTSGNICRRSIRAL